MAKDRIIDPIVAAVQSGDLAGAERQCREALALDPGDPDLLVILGFALQRDGRVHAALAPFRRLTELFPGAAVHWGNYATALRYVDDLAAAVAAATKAVELEPESAKWREQLGLLEFSSGEWAKGRDTLLDAWTMDGRSASVWIHAIQACIACRDSRVGTLLEPWRSWLPLEDDNLQLELARALSETSRLQDAIEALVDLRKRVPNNVPAALLLARCYERVNSLVPAEALLDQVAASGLAMSEELRRSMTRQRAQLAKRKRAYTSARSLLEHLGEEDATDYGHYFALAEVCDKLGDTASTMAALAVAHARQVAELRKYAAYLTASNAPPLPHANDRIASADYQHWPVLEAPSGRQSPLFVVGFPRSGTTLVEQMLDAHPRLQSMDEHPFFNQLSHRLEDAGVEVPRDLGTLTQRDCDELRKGYTMMTCEKIRRDWRARLVDKNPLNLLWLPMIHRMFPEAKFVLILRHPCDVVLSCYLQNFRAGPLAAACRTLESLAHAYVAALDSWLYHVELMHPDLFVLRYEELVADAPLQARRLATFLGLADGEPMLGYRARAQDKGFIATPSYSEVIEPVHAGRVNHWLRYREYFEPVLPALEPLLTRLGYTVPTGIQ